MSSSVQFCTHSYRAPHKLDITNTTAGRFKKVSKQAMSMIFEVQFLQNTANGALQRTATVFRRKPVRPAAGWCPAQVYRAELSIFAVR